MVLVLLGPADEDRAVAVEPRVTGLDHPRGGPPVGRRALKVDLLLAGTDVWRQLILGDQVAGLAVVAGLIQTDAPRRLGRRLGPRDGDLSQACPLAAGGRSGWRRRGRARPGPRRLRQAPGVSPLFSSISGVRAGPRPPSGALVMAPSPASQAQSMPTTSSYSSSPWRQNSMEHARPFPLPPSGGGVSAAAWCAGARLAMRSACGIRRTLYSADIRNHRRA